jgi:hypothetical protein
MDYRGSYPKQKQIPPSGEYIQVPDFLHRATYVDDEGTRRKFTPNMKFVYGLFYSYSKNKGWVCTLSWEYMVARLNISKSTLKLALENLCRAQAVKKLVRKGVKNTNMYLICFYHTESMKQLEIGIEERNDPANWCVDDVTVQVLKKSKFTKDEVKSLGLYNSDVVERIYNVG